MSVQPAVRRDAVVQLSIIIPAFNAERYLEECVDSILGQSFSEFELLLVNDGSTDRTAWVAEALSHRDPRVRVFHLENGGPSSARNFGLQQARGTYVQFVDADDVLEPDCLQTVCEAVERGYPDLLVFGARIVDAQMAETARIDVPASGVYEVECLLGNLSPASKATLLHYVWNKWYQRSRIQAHSLSFDADERLGEDFLFNCDYWRTCRKIGLIDEPLYRYCKRDATSLTRRFRPDELSRRRKMDARLFALFEHSGIREGHQPVLEALVGSIAMDSLSSVVLAGCRLPVRERVVFIRHFIDSEYGEYIERYAASEHLSVSRRLEATLVRRGAAGALYAAMTAVAWGKSTLSRVRRSRVGAHRSSS